METNQWNIKEIRSGLSSNDSRILLNTLQEVKNSGSPAVIPELVSLLRNTQLKEIRDHVVSILNHLKNQSSAEELVRQIRQESQQDVMAWLVSACWKNGLNYSDYIDDFIEVFVRSDYITALDALTVIENATENHERGATVARINRLKEHIDQVDGDKRELILELIRVLDQKIPH